MKRAQITTFVVIGLVVLILVGMTVYFVISTTKRQGQKNVKITQQSTIRTQAIANFISACLDKVAKNATFLASRQGGYIFTDQGGLQGLSQMSVSYYDYDQDGDSKTDYHVAYAITVNNDVLIDLNKGESFPNTRSVQNQLEFYINNTIDKCIDFSALERQGFSIKKSGKNVQVKISERGVAVNLYYPIDAAYKKTGENAHYENFNADINVGLNKTYGVANYIASTNHEKNSGIAIANYQEPPRIQITELEVSDIDGAPDQLIMINDTTSKIQGENYEFWFVKENWLTQPE